MITQNSLELGLVSRYTTITIRRTNLWEPMIYIINAPTLDLDTHEIKGTAWLLLF
jgi:hypothetical protein